MWIVYDSGEHHHPRVTAELFPAGFGRWRWEISRLDAPTDDLWWHDWPHDGSRWLLSRAIREAQRAADDRFTSLILEDS